MNRSNADEVALELIKQLITLGTGTLALTAAFIDKLPSASGYNLAVLSISWVALLISIFCGLKTISAIVKSRLDDNDNWSTNTGKRYAQACQVFFLIGIVCFALFALISIITSHFKSLPEINV
jgi:hypothetical protein